MKTVWDQIYEDALNAKMAEECQADKKWRQDKDQFRELYHMLDKAFPGMVEAVYIEAYSTTKYHQKTARWDLTVHAGPHTFTVAMFRNDNTANSIGILPPQCQPFGEHREWEFAARENLIPKLKDFMTRLAAQLVRGPV